MEAIGDSVSAAAVDPRVAAATATPPPRPRVRARSYELPARLLLLFGGLVSGVILSDLGWGTWLVALLVLSCSPFDEGGLP